MAKGAYIGVLNKAHKIKKGYIGVGGKARKVKKAYIGVNGKARLWWTSGVQQFIAPCLAQNIIDLIDLNGNVTRTTVSGLYSQSNTPIFLCGDTYFMGSNGVNTFYYSKNLTTWSTITLPTDNTYNLSSYICDDKYLYICRSSSSANNCDVLRISASNPSVIKDTTHVGGSISSYYIAGKIELAFAPDGDLLLLGKPTYVQSSYYKTRIFKINIDNGTGLTTRFYNVPSSSTYLDNIDFSMYGNKTLYRYNSALAYIDNSGVLTQTSLNFSYHNGQTTRVNHLVYFNDVIVGANTNYTSGTSNYVSKSVNLGAWSRSSLMYEVVAGGVATELHITYGDGLYLLSYRDRLYKSTDGLTWTRLTSEGLSADRSYTGITYSVPRGYGNN